MQDGLERPNQLPDRNWDQVRNDWQDRRDDIRNDWQDHRDEVRDDWQDWHDDHYPWYGGWYWGFAPGYWGAWDHLWDEYPVAAAVGFTSWGANSMGYTYGCDDYYNPYYADSGSVDYSEPIVTQTSDTGQPSTPEQESIAKFDQARAAFYDGKYDDALKLVDEAVVKLPQDAVLHEFRSLVLFALGRYSESAAAIHAVLAVGPGWDWKTLISLYPNVDVYTTQLRALETHRKANSEAADERFLLGYHYLTCGHTERALAEFQNANKLQPKDEVSANLVKSLTPRDPAETAKSDTQPAGAAPTPVAAEKITGSWKASGKSNSSYNMTLTSDGQFTWSFERGKRKDEVKGVYAVEGNVLAMQPETGGTMLAELKVEPDSNLNFRMVGADKDDPGLEFTKSQN